ncbi:MAG: phosphatase PAP2 family protein [Promethearchaeota archaeon]
MAEEEFTDDLSELVEETRAEAALEEAGGEKGVPLGAALVGVSLLVVAGLTVLCLLNGGAYDRAISEYFQYLGRQNENLLELSEFLDSDLGQLPSYATIGVALIIVILYFIPSTKQKVQPYVKYAGLVVLVALLGPIAINRLLKGLMSRPRPGVVASGEMSFEPLFGNNPDSPMGSWSWSSGSFTSGHTAQAAVLFTIPFCFNRKKTKPLMVLTAILSSAYVVMMGMARMVTGAHWFSDVLYGGYIVLLLTYVTYKWILFIPEQEQWDQDNLILKPYDRAYLNVLRARDILEGKEPRRIKYEKVVEEVPGAEPDEDGKVPKVEKMVPVEEIPTDPRALLQEALDLYAEARLRAEDDPEKFQRQLTNIANWEPRVRTLLEKYDKMEAGELTKEEYMSDWTYVI